jgi:hypothetical protein
LLVQELARSVVRVQEFVRQRAAGKVGALGWLAEPKLTRSRSLARASDSGVAVAMSSAEALLRPMIDCSGVVSEGWLAEPKLTRSRRVLWSAFAAARLRRDTSLRVAGA